ncbi:MAG TPA: LLM class F420-dependent oxidoreductase [Mycobacteriales bacterium]|nr:LLM class F420-dependent oxidoreductase [Mycobacteriales bacterium]
MRYGIHTDITGSFDGAPMNAIDELVARAREAHSLGLDFYIPQMFQIDALTAIAVVGREVPGLQVGTAVVPTYPRHPMMLATQALTTNAAAGGNLVLGIGLSHQLVIENVFGMSYDKPVRHMREYLEILMPALRGEQLAYKGEMLGATMLMPNQFDGAAVPPVIVAALGTQMLNVAGRLADGTALWMTGPKTVADHIVPTITKAAQDAGRPAPRVAMGIPVSVTADPDAARERANKIFAMYNNLPSYRAMLDREGAGGPADVAVVGDEETVAAELRRMADIGATDLTLPVFGSPEERARTMTLLGDLAKNG